MRSALGLNSGTSVKRRRRRREEGAPLLPQKCLPLCWTEGGAEQSAGRPRAKTSSYNQIVFLEIQAFFRHHRGAGLQHDPGKFLQRLAQQLLSSDGDFVFSPLQPRTCCVSHCRSAEICCLTQ
ncbi:unnamed protein product [Pleuronectes platessa]|uniref:Uncharacterized protein n=1 Tax=Pleuronectes platessa TaxID=8262 RepID=A0A9N7VIN2_PLEPL|nr:unnamed protein product [Pleuronectes platessa]